MNKIWILCGLLYLIFTSVAFAQLDGNRISLSVDIYDNGRVIGQDPQSIVTVGAGVEYPQLVDSAGNGLQVVPISVDLEGNRIAFDLTQSIFSAFASADFNGYVFTDFDNTLLPFSHAFISNQTNFGLTNSRLRATENSLYVNVSGLPIYSTSTVEVTLVFTNKRTKPKIQFGSPSSVVRRGSTRFSGRVIDSNQVLYLYNRVAGHRGFQSTAFSQRKGAWGFSFNSRRVRGGSFTVIMTAGNICGESTAAAKRFRIRG